MAVKKARDTCGNCLAEILNIANEAYPDGFLSEYYDTRTGKRKTGSGDLLAEFIVEEITEVFDATATKEQNLEAAKKAILRAGSDADAVALRLQAAYEAEAAQMRVFSPRLATKREARRKAARG